MKIRLTLLPPCMLAVAMIAACEKSAPPKDNDAEIERRVQERVAQERQADQAKTLSDKDAALKQKEQDLADREADLQKQRAAQANVSPLPVPDDSADDEDAPPVVSNSAFYDSLSPYGQWLQIPGRDGYVWQPFVTQQNPNWRPYQLGRWAYTDQGWTWVSDEPFGWATYHYGRWTRLREAGWVWVPGDEWAPAWVSWRESDDYVGWSPLPPEADFGGTSIISYDAGYVGGGDYFCFVPIARFCEPRISTFIVAQQYNLAIVNKTVNITKIVRNRGKNQRSVAINNPGPQAKVIQQKTGREVRPLQISPRRGSGTSQVSGNTLQVGVPARDTTTQRSPSHVRPLPNVDREAQKRTIPAPVNRQANEDVPKQNENVAQYQERIARERAKAAQQQAGNPLPSGTTKSGNIVQRAGETFEQARERLNQQENRQRLPQNASSGVVPNQVQTPPQEVQRPTMRTGDQIQPMERGQRQPNQAIQQQQQQQPRVQPAQPQPQQPQRSVEERAQRQAQRAAQPAAAPATTTTAPQTTETTGDQNGGGNGNGGGGKGNGNGNGNGGQGGRNR